MRDFREGAITAAALLLLVVCSSIARATTNGDVDGKESIAFGLNANSVSPFIFDASTVSGDYTLYDTYTNTTIDIGILQTFGGLRLTLLRASTIMPSPCAGNASRANPSPAHRRR